jgi:hypothetical protein
MILGIDLSRQEGMVLKNLERNRGYSANVIFNGDCTETLRTVTTIHVIIIEEATYALI